MAAWLAPSLDTLRGQVLDRWTLPKGKAIGWIGDAAHAARKSEHNADPDGSVDAIDVPHIPSIGLDAHQLAWEAIADPRCRLVISRSRIWSRARAAEGWRPYKGPNPHDAHSHIETTDDGQMDRSLWRLPILGFPLTPPPFVLHPTTPTPPILEEDDDMASIVRVNEDASTPTDLPHGAVVRVTEETWCHLSATEFGLEQRMAALRGTPLPDAAALPPISQTDMRGFQRTRRDIAKANGVDVLVAGLISTGALGTSSGVEAAALAAAVKTALAGITVTLS